MNAQRRAEEAARFGQQVVERNIATMPRDRFGAPIEVGSSILYRPEVDMVFQVTDAKPVLDPRAPTGLLQIVVQCQATLTVRAGLPFSRMIALGVTNPPPSPDELPPDPSGIQLTDAPVDTPAPQGDTPAS